MISEGPSDSAGHALHPHITQCLNAQKGVKACLLEHGPNYMHAVYEPASRKLVYTNAGHNPPMVIRANGECVRLDTPDVVLGQISDWQYQDAVFQLESGDKLVLYTSNQMIAWGRGDVAKTLGLPKDNVRLVSPFIGGGFGGKLFVRADAILAALGARAAGRPVKLALQRPLIFNNATHRPATIQRIRIGAGVNSATP